MRKQTTAQAGLEPPEPGNSANRVSIAHGGRLSPRPSFLHGWSFLSIVASDDEEALAFRASAADAGPSIIYNPDHVSLEDMEAPSNAILWLCSALSHISYSVLLECVHTGDSIGRFASEAWDEFRASVSRHTCMEWSEIIEATKREGVDFMSEHLAACLFVESGLQDRLVRRIRGEPSLRIA